MRIHIDYNSGVPLLHQAVEQIKLLVVEGELQPGEKLPSIRNLSRQIKVNPTTVSRIYNELEHQGVIVLRQGQGVFVAEPGSRLAPEEIQRLVAEKARAMLVEGLHHGADMETIREIVEDEYRKIRGE